MRIALIGLGDIARKAYLPLLANDERVTPLLCTRSPSVLGKLARQYRIGECFTGRCAAGRRPDAVMIHAATAVHGKLAELCLRAGIPTFVDKPLCDSAGEVERSPISPSPETARCLWASTVAICPPWPPPGQPLT